LRLGAAPLPVLSAPSSMPEAGRLHAGTKRPGTP
jgi:hypothetical protein